MVAAIDIGSLVTRTENLNNRRPTIAGTRTSVSRIAVLYLHGAGAEEIARRMSHLSLAQIYAALAYYHANRHEIDAELADAETEYWKLVELHGNSNH